jgi:hypothetical protein
MYLSSAAVAVEQEIRHHELMMVLAQVVAVVLTQQSQFP